MLLHVVFYLLELHIYPFVLKVFYCKEK